MSDRLVTRFPSQGWKQVLTSRSAMLAAYDVAREQARSHEVETLHGRVAEAAVRDWLTGFLPKRYGVTSGYVVSAGLGSHVKTPHYDVIIYDQLEAPVLWIESSPDNSPQGASRALPVEHVRAVLEVKARMTRESVRSAVAHLRDLSPVLTAVDEPAAPYKVHLPPTFCCAFLCFELLDTEARSYAILDAATAGVDIRGFCGGLVLRAEGDTVANTGRLSLHRSEAPIPASSENPKTSLLRFAIGGSLTVTDNLHFGSTLVWTEFNFSQFAFDLIAMIQGTYEPGRFSSFYGLGTSEWDKATKDGFPATSGAA